MLNVLSSKLMRGSLRNKKTENENITNLTKANINTEYMINDIKTDDEELRNFLFSLGCYEGEPITVISVLAENYVIAVKDSRYSIDKGLAKAIII